MRIRSLMAEKGISVREVQEILGLESPQAVYKWLHGTSLPALDNLLALSRVLGVRMEDILVWEETGRYPIKIKGIQGDTFAVSGDQEAPVPEEAATIRRQGRSAVPAGPSHLSDLQAAIRWNLWILSSEGIRRSILRSGRRKRYRAALAEKEAVS